MRVLLVPPTFHYKTEYPAFLSFSDFPTGFGYLASALKQAGHEVYGCNPNNIVGYANAYLMLQDTLSKKIAECKPELIGLGGLCTDYKFLKEAIGIIRQLTNAPIVLGGQIVTNDAEDVFNILKPDYAVKGAGENALLEIIKGSFPQKGLILTPPPLLDDLIPDYEPFDIQDMLDNYSDTTRMLYRNSRTHPRPFSIVASRSCPFACVPKGTLILKSDMKQVPIEEIGIGDTVIGVKKTTRWEYVKATVTQTFRRRDVIYAIETDDGTVYSTYEHPWLMHDKFLSPQDVGISTIHNGKIASLRHVLRKLAPAYKTQPPSVAYKWGYLAGASAGDGCFWSSGKTRRFRIVGDYEMLDRFLEYANELGIPVYKQKFNGGKIYKCDRAVALAKRYEVSRFEESLQEHPESPEFMRGWLAGMTDADGSTSGSLRICQTKQLYRNKIKKYMEELGYKVRVEEKALRLLGGLPEITKFWSDVQPSVRSTCQPVVGQKVKGHSQIRRIYPIGERDVYNLETTADTYIADGFVTHNCTFCTPHQTYRARSIESIMEEIRVTYEKYRFNILILLDELFAVKNDRLKDFSVAVAEGKNKYGWDFDWMFQTHASAKFDLETLKMAREAGCISFSYGLESAAPAVLKSMNKKIEPEQVAQAIRMAEEAKIGFSANLIFGDPAETQETVAESLAFWLEYGKRANIFLAALRPYPGSQLFEWCQSKGLFKDKKEFYEHIDEQGINLTQIPNHIYQNIMVLVEYLERNWMFVKSASNVKKFILPKGDSPLEKMHGGGFLTIQATCPYCGEESTYREFRSEPEKPFFMGTGCVSCQRRLRVEIV